MFQRMSQALAIALALGALAVLPNGAAAGPYTALFAVGDSLTDSGNVFAQTGNTVPRPDFYDNGRFSNGPNWADGLAARLGLAAAPALLGGTNFAFAGARTGLGSRPTGQLNIRTQVQQIVGLGLGGDPNALYAVWGGGDDLRDAIVAALFAPTPAAGAAAAAAIIADAVTNLSLAITDLWTAGARNILSLNIADLGLVPETQAFGPVAVAVAGGLTTAFNAGLDAALDALALGLLDIDIRRVDVYGLTNRLVDGFFGDPAGSPFANVTDACFTGTEILGGTVCADPDSYIWWDRIHPTAVAHDLVAEAARDAVVPEPAALVLFGVGLVGFGLMRRRAVRAG